eukprot:11213408-Lingulodinium_polyedra.AAC.1
MAQQPVAARVGLQQGARTPRSSRPGSGRPRPRWARGRQAMPAHGASREPALPVLRLVPSAAAGRASGARRAAGR